MTQLSKLGRAAAAYARLGWQVFPLKPCSKKPIFEGGFHRATADEHQVREWWTRWPEANIGGAMTEESGLMAVDCDPRNYEDYTDEKAPFPIDTLQVLQDLHEEIPSTLTQNTAGGGLHFIFRRPPELRFRGNLDRAIAPGRRLRGIDIKANGYLVMTPSRVGENAYEWRDSHDAHPTTHQPADLPDWLCRLAVKLNPEVTQESTGPAGSSFLATAFAHAGWLKQVIDETKVAVQCPWEGEHSDESAPGDSSTVVFAPTAERPDGWFHCLHAHCEGQRRQKDVVAELPEDAKVQARLDILGRLVMSEAS